MSFVFFVCLGWEWREGRGEVQANINSEKETQPPGITASFLWIPDHPHFYPHLAYQPSLRRTVSRDKTR